MARFASVIEIAGISYTGCRGLLINGEEFADAIRGSVNWGLESTPHPHSIDTLFKGLPFGVSLGSDDGGNLISKVNLTLNAIKTARATVGYFTFVWVDEQYNINAKLIQDFNQQWYTTGRYSEGVIKGITFRFIVREANAISLSS